MQVSRYAYIQAKIQGMFARSYLGERLRQILRLKQISEIYSFLFNTTPPQVPEREMILLLQKKIVERNIATDIMVITSIRNPPHVLVQLLRRYEYRELKALIRRAGTGEADLEYSNLIGEYGQIHDARNVSLREILSGSPYEWVVDEVDHRKPVFLIENELDRQYYRELWADVQKLGRDERRPLEELVLFEILLQNLTWMLRLMVYFKKDREQTESLMMAVPDSRSFPEILSAFTFTRDSVPEWENWKYSWLIKEQLTDDFRGVDPAEAEFRSIRLLYRKYRQMFHSHPFTVVPIYCFFRLKDFETEILQSVLEGVRISAPEDEILGLLGGL